MAALTSELVVRVLDQASGPARNIARNLRGIKNAVNGIDDNGFGRRMSDALEANNRALDRARANFFDAAAAAYVLKAAITGPVKEAMAFESAMADVKKVVDFDTPDGFKNFQTDLLNMSKRVPLAVNGLADIAAAAGQAGIAREDILKFTESAAKIGVAFDISAKDAGDAMSKLMTGLDLTLDDAVKLTDAMNFLSNAQASSASEVLDVVRRVGAQGKQFGFTAEQVAAFGSAMISAGNTSDVSATSFVNMGRALTRGAGATKRQNEAFKRLGMNSKKVAKAMQADAVGTTVKVLEAISQLPKEMQASVSSDLFGDEARALGPLLTNLGLVKDSLGLVSDQSKYAGSSFREYGTQSQTFANSVALFDNQLDNLKIQIGSALMPALNDLMKSITPAVEGLASFASDHPQVVANVAKIVGAIVGLKLAVAGLRFVGLMGKGGVLSFLSSTAMAFDGEAAGKAYGNRFSKGMRASLKFGMAGLGAWAAYELIRDIPSTPEGWAELQKRNQERDAAASKALMENGGKSLNDLLGFEFLREKDGFDTSPAKKALDGISERLSKLFATPEPGADGQVLTPEQIRKLEDAARPTKADFGQAIDFKPEAMIDADGVENAFSAARTAATSFKTELATPVMPTVDTSEIDAAFAKASALAQALRSLNGHVNITTGTMPTIDGARAAGGPVQRGKTFLVGEEGPELFSPQRSGHIWPNPETAQLKARPVLDDVERERPASQPLSQAGSTNGAAQVRAAPTITVNVGGIRLQGFTDWQEASRKISYFIEQETREALRGAHFDGDIM